MQTTGRFGGIAVLDTSTGLDRVLAQVQILAEQIRHTIQQVQEDGRPRTIRLNLILDIALTNPRDAKIGELVDLKHLVTENQSFHTLTEIDNGTRQFVRRPGHLWERVS